MTLRLLVVVLLAVALPLQGFAAVAGIGCPLEQADAASSMASSMDDDDGSGHCPAVEDSGHRCSACALCVAVAALPATVRPMPSVHCTMTVATARACHVPAFVGDNPERPPRTDLA